MSPSTSVYPNPASTSPGVQYGPARGINARDWLAAQAMTGILAGSDETARTNVAKIAYEVADAMLAQSEKGDG